MKSKNIPINLTKTTLDRKFELGERVINELNSVFQYCKLDFGICGKDTKTGKVYRYIEYGWICTRWRGML